MANLPGIVHSSLLIYSRYALIGVILLLLPGLEAVQASDADSLSRAASGSDQVILLNADALRLTNAEGQMRVFDQARIQLKHTDAVRYQEVSHKYRVSRRLCHKYQRLARITEAKIQHFAHQNPELYQYLNRITTESGNKVYAYIGSEDRFSSEQSTGMTYIRYLQKGQDASPVLLLSEESEQGILLLHPQENAIKIVLAADGDLTDTRHELGHFEVAVTQSQSYFKYLSHLSPREIAHYDGHHFDDPAGKKALQYER
jgi:hypothetical protein